MSKADDQALGRRLEESLHDRVDSMTRSPLSLADVRGRARRIRRNRALAAGAGLAAAVAVIVPTALMTTGALDRADAPMPAEIAPSPVPDAVTLDAGAPLGDPPTIGWLEGQFIHLPDGNTIRTQQRYGGVSFVAGHVLAWFNDPDTGRWKVQDLAADGSVTTTSPSLGPPITAGDATASAWRAPDASIMLFTGDTTAALAFGAPGQPVAVDTGAEAVWLNLEGEDAGSVRVDSVGRQTVPIPSAIVVNDVHDGSLVSATTEVDGVALTSCGGVFEDGDERWSTCEHTLESFSPDGEWVQATDPTLSGAGQGTAVILDADDGERQVGYDAGEGFIVQQVWEDATHLLVTHFSYEEQVWRVFRLGLDGSVEQATTPSRGTDLDPAVVLRQ